MGILEMVEYGQYRRQSGSLDPCGLGNRSCVVTWCEIVMDTHNYSDLHHPPEFDSVQRSWSESDFEE